MKIQRLFFVLLATSFLLVGCGGTDLVITTDPAPTDPAPTPTPTAPDLTTRQGLFDAYGASLLAGDVPAIMALYDTGYLSSGWTKANEDANLTTFLGGGNSYTTATFTVINQANYSGLEIAEVNLNLSDSTGLTFTDFKRFYYLINTGGNFYLHGDQWDGVQANCPYTGITGGSTAVITPGFTPASGATISRANGVTLSMTYDHTITSDHPARVGAFFMWTDSGTTESVMAVLDNTTLIQPVGTVVTAIAPPPANLTLAAPTVDNLGNAFAPDSATLLVSGQSSVCGGITSLSFASYVVNP